jgi:DNA-binding CsgD family transcriptional regulator
MSRVPPYHLMVEKIASLNPDDVLTETVLKLIAESYGMSHVAYLGLQLPMKEEKLPLVQVTYPESWVDRYVEQGYINVDPVISTALKSLFPTDWSSLKSESKLVKKLFGEAKEFGVGTQGLTFPIRGASGERALFSIVGNFSDQEWASFKKENLPCFNVLAFHIHSIVIKQIGATIQEVKLSPREVECLKWASQGKTFQDIGDILSISNSTVRMYLDAARHKLNCLNITHAVVRAIRLELIPPC